MDNSIDEIIRNRRTKKVLGDPSKKMIVDDEFNKQLWEAVEVAQWAPFHYPCHETHRTAGSESMLPWRFYVLDCKACNALVERLEEIGSRYPDDVGWANVASGKIVRMLSSAGAMVQVTWLPDPPFANSNENKELELEKRNTEHLAAAAAAVQNLILSAEAKDMDTYWSSGGKLREIEVFELLGIPSNQKMLGSIFLFPKNQDDSEIAPGKLRDRRGKLEEWAKKIDLGNS